MPKYSAPGTALQTGRTGVILVNLGTPEAPTTSAVRKYLSEFLSDPRVVELPRYIWTPVLQVILALRSPRSAKLYRKIWTPDGSPLLLNTMRISTSLQLLLGDDYQVVTAMRYGSPNMRSVIDKLIEDGIQKLVIIPMYPQYSGSTTGSVFDAVAEVLTGHRVIPEVRYIREYYRNDLYIQALAHSVEEHWGRAGRANKLLFSFHGIPRKYVDSGDPYANHCEETARLLAEKLGLGPEEWQLVFQSRFGREEWLQPYCDETLKQMPADGVESVDICCPGFSTDCLETLDEINRENREIFLLAGGDSYNFIPCLNDSPAHIRMFANIVSGRGDSEASPR